MVDEPKITLKVKLDNIFQMISNKVTSWSQTPSNDKYPSEKLVKDNLDLKENLSNKTNSITDSSTNTQYPSAKGVYDLVSALSGGGISDFYIDTETDEIVIEANGSGGGGGGSVDIVTEWEQTLSDGKVPSEKLTKLSIDDKANINHTHTKNQITDFPTIPSKTSDLQNDSGFLTEHQSIKTVDGNSLIGTGNIVINYNDLSNKPTIPSKVSDLQNDSGFITSSAISSMVTTSDIANDLNTTISGKVLDARQGKVLNDLIGQAITYINK